MRRTFNKYENCAAYEREKLKDGYVRIAEYKDYYLYEKRDRDGKFLYRECFSKFDVDGVPKRPRIKKAPYWTWFR